MAAAGLAAYEVGALNRVLSALLRLGDGDPLCVLAITQRLSRRPLLAILICRKIDNREAPVKRAREICVDKHGFIIALDDNDLRALVDTVQKGADSVFDFLVDRFIQIAQ